MLQAKTKGGQLVTLALLTKREIADYKTHVPFFCPMCHEQVMVKAGTKTIPHFAHRSFGNCPSQEGGEGGYHEKGKLALYQWLKYQQLDVKLETYLPEIKQRPDLLVTINQKKIAIEYQCARIPIEIIRKRNKGYHLLGIKPIWIVGAKHFRRVNQNQIKLDQFLRQFIHQFSPDAPLTSYFFCPNTFQFSSFQYIQLTTAQQAIGTFMFSPLNNMIFTDIFHQHRLPIEQRYRLWSKEKRRFRLRPRRQLYGRELDWHQWLYLKRTHVEHLPSVIHLPVPTQYLMKAPLWDWQSRLCLELLDPLPIGGHISLQTCERLLRKQKVPPANFPLINANLNPIQQYLFLLRHLHILKQQSPCHFIKQNHLLFPENSEQALEMDGKVMNVLVQSKYEHESGGIRYTK
jgi:competence CoiA-like predicted nuclease